MRVCGAIDTNFRCAWGTRVEQLGARRGDAILPSRWTATEDDNPSGKATRLP
jgi:hypothetical protein